MSDIKELVRLPFNLQELHELEADVARIFADADLTGQEAKCTMQKIANNLKQLKAYVRAQNYLVRIGAVRLVDKRSAI